MEHVWWEYCIEDDKKNILCRLKVLKKVATNMCIENAENIESIENYYISDNGLLMENGKYKW